MRKIQSIALALSLSLLALAAGGCVFWAPTLDPIRQEIERTQPGTHFDPEIQVRLGRLSMALTRVITRAALDDEDDPEAAEIARLLRHVKGVEVAVYEVDALPAGAAERWAAEMAELGHRRGWRLAARIQEDDTLGSVHYQQRGERIKNVYVFALDDDSLVLARFKGSLDEAIADAIALQGRRLPDAVVDGVEGDGQHQGEHREAGAAEPAADEALAGTEAAAAGAP